MAEPFLDCLRDQVALRLEGGARFADLQDELIGAAPAVVAFTVARGLTDTGRKASAAASMPLAAALRPRGVAATGRALHPGRR